MKWAILGHNSFTGSNFKRYLEARGENVLGIGHPELDLDLNTNTIASLIAGFDPHYVVNFISKSLVNESWSDPGAWFQTNCVSTVRLIDRLRLLPLKKYVHVSTPEVYGRSSDYEESRIDPSTPYACSRAAMDMMLTAYHRAFGFPVVFTRSANVYGPGQTKRIIPIAIQAKREDRPVTLEGDGDSFRSFVHIRDVCEATRLVAEKGYPGETYHIATKRLTRIVDLVEMIGAQWVSAPPRIGHDYAYKLDCTNTHALGWRPTVSLEEGLEELCKLPQSA